MRGRFPDFDVNYYAPPRQVEPLSIYVWKQLSLARTLAPLPLLLWREIGMVAFIVVAVREIRRWR